MSLRLPVDSEPIDFNVEASNIAIFKQNYDRDWITVVEEPTAADRVEILTTEWLFASSFLKTTSNGIEYGVVVSRQYRVFIYRIMLIMAFFSIIPLTGFCLDAQADASNRLGLLVTMLLTCTAYALVVSAQLPTLGYLTLLHQHILGAFASTLMITLQFAAVKYFNASPKTDRLLLLCDSAVIAFAHKDIMFSRLHVAESLSGGGSKEDNAFESSRRRI